jgi:S-adenosylmethionine:tRNA ribosyltransferase-isomerase
MKLSDFDYTLPPELIAQKPAEKRNMSRLLLLDKKTGMVDHDYFSGLGKYLYPGDCLVMNDTRVIPARLLGKREDTGGSMEFVLLKDHGDDTWEVLVRPGKRASSGKVFLFGENNELRASVLDILPGGSRLVSFEYSGIFLELLEDVGIIPLPPYIKGTVEDMERYQTIYSKYPGSAASPTAGLHFTPELLSSLKEKGIKQAFVTLHIGLGTFRPVKTQDIREHRMHEEDFTINSENCDLINETRKNNGRVIAVGTTACRVLESASDENGYISPKQGTTDIFIYPGYKFKAVDELITNFHLPRSTLIMLISALAGRENVLEAYRIAVNERYRFFSFGDAMFIYNGEKFDGKCV